MYTIFVEFTWVLVLAAVLEAVMQSGWIRWMRAHRIQQVTKMYGPSWHEKTKAGTPTMGGVVFIPAFMIPFFIFSYLNPNVDFSGALVIFSYPLFAAFVGLIDDYMKYKRQASDGITSLQKLSLQILMSVLWVCFAMPEDLWLVPGIKLSRFIAIPLITFLGVGIQNAVNVTDGLDGLAAGCALISFFGAFWFIAATPLSMLAIAAACGICLGFMWHNANPAAVFMGDVGAHFLAGLLLTICVTSQALLLIVPLCFLFGIEMISVSLQIFTIRKWNKRIFLMAPLHHHFEKKGWSETQVVTRFWVIHLVGMLVTISLCFLLFWPA